MFSFPKTGAALARDFKWTGNHHHGFVHIGGRDREQMLARAMHASALLGWPSPTLDLQADPGCPSRP